MQRNLGQVFADERRLHGIAVCAAPRRVALLEPTRILRHVCGPLDDPGRRAAGGLRGGSVGEVCRAFVKLLGPCRERAEDAQDFLGAIGLCLRRHRLAEAAREIAEHLRRLGFAPAPVSRITERAAIDTFPIMGVPVRMPAASARAGPLAAGS